MLVIPLRFGALILFHVWNEYIKEWIVPANGQLSNQLFLWVLIHLFFKIKFLSVKFVSFN